MKRTFFPALMCLAVLGFVRPAAADSVIITFDTSSDNYDSGPMPVPLSGNTFLTLTFTDVSADVVDLVIQANFANQANLGADEIAFNVSPDSLLNLAVSNQVHIDLVGQGADGESIPPAQGFDLDITLGQGSSNLQGTQTASVRFTKTGLTAQAFNTTNAFGKYAAIHVQDTGSNNNNSTKLFSGTPTVVPLPAAAWMGMGLMASIGGATVLRRRRDALV